MTDEHTAEIGKYRLIAKLGEGGMGAVYLAEHVLMGKRVALKLIRAEVAGNPELTSRFINEARAAARLPHPGIVQVFDCGLDAQGRAYLAMELLRGESLGGFLRRHRSLAGHPALMRRLGRDTALAVHAAHAAGIVHRDLKPDNLFLSVHHEGPAFVDLKVLDFGVAKLAAAISGPDAHSTQSGALVGTVLYMSPEQCLGAKTIDGRSDIYALGCIIYEMASGRTPFENLGVGATIAAHLTETPPRLRDVAPDVDEALDALVMRMLAKDPGARPADMNAVANALAEGLPPGMRGGPIALPAGLSVPNDEPGRARAGVAATISLDATQLLGTPAPPAASAPSPSTPAPSPPPAAAKPQTTLTGAASAVSAVPAPRRSRTGVAVVAVLAVAGVAAALAVFRPGPLEPTAQPPLPPTPVQTVSVQVTGPPSGARALLDGRPVAFPLQLTRDAIEHELRIEAAGFEPFVDRIRAERDLRIAVTLKALPLPPPPPPEPIPEPKHERARERERAKSKLRKQVVVDKATPGKDRSTGLITDID